MRIKLNIFEEEKYKTIKRVCEGQLSKERAEVNLELSFRSIQKHRTAGKTYAIGGKFIRNPW